MPKQYMLGLMWAAGLNLYTFVTCCPKYQPPRVAVNRQPESSILKQKPLTEQSLTGEPGFAKF